MRAIALSLRLVLLCLLGGGPVTIAQAQDMTPQVQTLALQCTAKTGESVQLEGGVLITYFSVGSVWTLTIDMDNSMASVDLRADRRGTQITFSEKYRMTINSDYYTLLSAEIRTGALSNGVYNVHDIELTIDRHTGRYQRVLRLQNLNAATGTYSYHVETGECIVKPAAPSGAAAVKF